VSIEKIVEALREFYNSNSKTLMDRISIESNPFYVLVGCIISQRTKDETTEYVTKNLFKIVKNANDLLNTPLDDLEKVLYPSGFYKVKAKRLKELAKILISHLTKESFSIEEFRDRYTEALKELIKAKLEGREFKIEEGKPKEEEKSLLEALKASIEVSRKKKGEEQK